MEEEEEDKQISHHVPELGLSFFRGQFLAEWSFTEEHVAIIGQQFWTL